MASRNSRIYRLWMDIQDIVGPANLWPISIRRLFWTRPLRHWQRILLCTFAYINGLNPEVLQEWVMLLRLVEHNYAIRHMHSFFALVERGRNYSLYSWNVSTGRYEWLDGRPRTYLPRGERYSLENPWNFFKLFMSDETQVNEWCRRNGLLVTQLRCTSKKRNGSRSSEGEKCDGIMVLKESAARTGGEILRCTKNRNHQKAMRVNSFFEGSTLTIPDCMLFIKSYLDRLTLLQCSKFVGIAYGTTAVNWGSFVREVFKEHFHRYTRFKKLSGIVEIDESLFGKRTKYHRGNPHGGMKVWIFGMVERESNIIIMYPVADRSAATLIPLIQRHVEPGATIYSDGWTAYCDLNDLGYRHFTVLHKYSFKKVYKNVTTGEEEVVCTNQIEGAWKHAKDHFRRMSGTKVRQFEGHLAEIMWRSEKKGNLYGGFFESLKTIFTLESAPDYQYTTPLFDSWTMDADSTVAPINTDAEISTSESESVDSDIPPNRFRETPLSSIRSTATDEVAHEIIGSDTSPLSSAASARVLKAASSGTSTKQIIISSSSADEADKTLTEPGPSTSAPSKSKVSLRRKRVGSPKSKVTSKKEKVCAPVGFKPVDIIP